MKTSSTPLVHLDVEVSGLGTTRTECHIDQLPFELLKTIFFLSITLQGAHPSESKHPPDFNFTIMAISHTCTRWRSMTHASPKLWSVIEDTLLDLSIDTLFDPDCDTSPAAPPEGSDDKITKLIDMLKQETKRWNRVKLSFDRPNAWSSLANMDLQCALNLTYVEIRQPRQSYNNFTNLYAAPFLTEARWYSAIDICRNPKFHRVQYHNFTRVSFPSMDLGYTLLLLQFCQRLVYLDIYNPIHGPGLLLDEPITLPRLETLAIRYQQVALLLDHLILPNLKELTLSHRRNCAPASLQALTGMISRSKCTLEKFILVDFFTPERSLLKSIKRAASSLGNIKVLELRFRAITEPTVEALTPHFQIPDKRSYGSLVVMSKSTD
ncbi:hypothetical protein BDN72DRAFT_882095 [Pluteus cervinus]|uniref:Uncharacterized protein n=1 Tax=Pluteus cervinus TaxID=181527 RepID=A0ACD3ADQ1_9AGAR|nr:hypothetical protein BDN72DRAFT_882095 [Pluteus cervinus]